MFATLVPVAGTHDQAFELSIAACKPFEVGRVKDLEDQPKPGRGNNVPENLVRHVVATVMSPPPSGHSHWSTRELAKRVSLGKTAVHELALAKTPTPGRTS